MNHKLDDLITLAAEAPGQRITENHVRSLTEDLSNEAFYNSLSLEVARRYQGGILSYTRCGSIMNDLWSILVGHLNGGMVPSPFYEIYEAFDAGEYHRKKDKTDSPETEFTRPMIEAILANVE